LIARKSSIIAFDTGTNYKTGWNDLKVAVSIQHFSTEIKYRVFLLVQELNFKVLKLIMHFQTSVLY
jgi:hypothetical protein